MAMGFWMLPVPFLAPVAFLVFLPAAARALIVPTDLPRQLSDKPSALAVSAGTRRGMFGIPARSWHSCVSVDLPPLIVPLVKLKLQVLEPASYN
jgi:hypothetical protein